MHTPASGSIGLVVLLLIQVAFIAIFGFVANYDEHLLPRNQTGTTEEPRELIQKYPLFQDIHIMIFIGFAFLMTFLKKYGYSASGFNLWVAALVVQWAIIVRGLFALENGVIRVSLSNMIGADVAAAAVLISMGAVLGRTTPVQLLTMGLLEIVFFAINEYINIELFKINDVGGSITVHAFGAYFGLTTSFILRPSKAEAKPGEHEGSSYNSDLFAMVGSIFLWAFWPSFNGALVDGDQQERAILHTYLSLAACTCVTMCLSGLLNKERKFDMVHVQNATLAGGVAVGSVVNLVLRPWGAMLIGSVAAVISVVGYVYISPILFNKMRLADTCGVHNLHGMPALLSGILSAIYAAMATKDVYGDELVQIFPAMLHVGNHTDPSLSYVVGGYNRLATTQGSYQLIGLLVTLSMAITGGLVTGAVLRSPSFGGVVPLKHLHDDEPFWLGIVSDNCVKPVHMPIIIRAEFAFKRALYKK